MMKAPMTPNQWIATNKEQREYEDSLRGYMDAHAMKDFKFVYHSEFIPQPEPLSDLSNLVSGSWQSYASSSVGGASSGPMQSGSGAVTGSPINALGSGTGSMAIPKGMTLPKKNDPNIGFYKTGFGNLGFAVGVPPTIETPIIEEKPKPSIIRIIKKWFSKDT
jgi:hypothetical protein